MAEHAYGFAKISPTANSKAVGRSLPVSTKSAVELCRMIKHKPVERVLIMLDSIVNQDLAVPHMRYKKGGIGHRPGIGPGRYPGKTAIYVKRIIESAASNAEQKGLNKSGLIVEHIAAHKAAKARHYGRSRTLMKRTTIEVVLGEKAAVKK